MKKIWKVLLITTACIALLLIALVGKIDRTPMEKTSHYAAWKAWIKSVNFETHTGAYQVGWSKVNITPAESVPMAGYGNRWGKHYEGIRDSSYVRVVAIRQPDKTTYLLSADMLIIPPNITNRLEKLLSERHISLQDVHLNATHTHHGQGGWGLKLAGRLFAGAYDEKVEIRLAEQFCQAIFQATDQLEDSKIYYSEVEDTDHIRNRLPIEDGLVDPWLRNLRFVRSDSSEAELVTYGAHPTVLNRKTLLLSRDYPGMLVDSIERKNGRFALFMSGAVGSMGAQSEGESDEAWAEGMASGLFADLIAARENEDVALSDSLISTYFEIPMPEQSARISKHFALRPWVFNTFFGRYPTFIKVTKIGKVLMLGMPADFSGEIMAELDQHALKQGLQLMLTSFNGGYVGYITPDRLYDRDLYETTTMSWNGYQAGGYFTEIAKDIIDKLAVK
ncbi:neutral/alkaline non-lysosomal ceramidase N-terminal domain-containing protein [Sphingobacterium corticis]|uniref:Neutral/alkaline non-lysosomal ceramidase N-terminal domain-containing protein n=1 Tax=Sphingobacterium corticis TaxID=1812823 RepID=A0ABW5NJ24_9SPHI